ncbi:MAG: E3 ubiquitin ligase family protein [Gammaproteobacteria bacterium]|nr:E3 ubiquitin ligase family protein [Gammaproteobacteria bacterium]
MQLDPYEFWVGVTLMIFLCLMAFYRMIRWHQHARTIENMPTAKIRSAAQGYVEVIGQTKLMDGPVITSPLTGKNCVWYRYKIEEKVRHYNARGKSHTHWQVVKKEISEELFLLEDDTGRCVVDPDGADVITTHKRSWYSRLDNPPKRYTEELILVNEPLYAIGLFKTVAEVEGHKIREHVSHLLREWKREPQQLLEQYDSNRDGQLDTDEWEKTRQSAEQQVKQEHGQREKLQQLHILKRSPHNDQAFTLSNISEKKLIQQYRVRALLALMGFFISGSFAIWAINIRLGI